MSIFNKIANYFRGYPRSDHGPVTPVGIGNRVMVDINGDLTYATCVNILSQAIAQCRWGIYDRASNAIPEASPGFKKVLNVRPYPGINAYDFWEYMERQRLTLGNAFALIRYKGLYLTHLAPLDASNVTVMWDDANLLDGQRQIVYIYRDPRDSRTYTILPEEILHFKAYSSNGIVGRPAIDILRSAMAASAEVESALRTAVSNGFAGTIMLQYTSDLSASRAKELQTQVMELLKTKDRTILPLPVGMTAMNIANDIRSYYETLKQAKMEDISALFGIPLALLNKSGGTGTATFSATQMMNFFSMTIQPIITRYACEMTGKLLTTQQQQDGLTIATENDVFDSLDAAGKASVLCSYTGAGILTPNEARLSIKYPKSDDQGADILTQRGGTGALGDSPGNEQGNKGGSNNDNS